MLFLAKNMRLMTLVQMRCFDVFLDSGICIMEHSASMTAFEAENIDFQMHI